MALSALQQCYAIVTTAFGAGGSMYTNGHRGADYDADADAWILAYDDVTITSIDHGSGLGWSVGLSRDTIGGFCGYAHIKNLQGAVGTTFRKGARIAQVAGWGDDHGSLWTGPHIHTTAGDESGYNCSVGVRPLYDPVPQINAALFAALPKPPSSSPADGGSTTPIEEDDMFTEEDRARLNAVYAALFGPKNLNPSGDAQPLKWLNNDGSAQSTNYGVLPIILHNQDLIAKAPAKTAAAVKAQK